MTAPDRARDPWTALARHLTAADPWRRVPFVQPPPAPPLEDPDDDQEPPAWT